MLEIEIAVLFPQRLMDEFPIDFKDSKTEQQIIAEDEGKKEAALRKQDVCFVPMPMPVLGLLLY